MKLVKDWISDFLNRHRVRFAPHDWPDPDSEEWIVYVRTWVTQLKLKDVSEPLADLASERLAGAPPKFRADHIPMLLAAIEAVRQEAGLGGGSVASTRDEAARASRDCEHCGGAGKRQGDGLVAVYHRHPSLEDRIPPTAAALCICPHGRWIKQNLAEKSPDLLRGFIDLARVLEGGGMYSIVPPGFDPAVWYADSEVIEGEAVR